MRFRVLGEVELVGPDGSSRAITSPSQRRLLGVLLAHSREIVSVDTLIEGIWGDDPPESALASLRTYVSRLRPHLAGALEGRGDGYQLDVAPEQVDAGRFDTLVRAAERAPSIEALGLLEEALALWRGAAYGDVADVPAVRAEARRLDERRTTAAERHAAALLGAGRAAEAVATAEALVMQHPLREGAWAVLVEALGAGDRPAEALRAFQRAADALAEAGLEPSARLRAAERAVLEGLAVGSGPAPGPAADGRRRPPRFASSFVGREQDRDQLADLLGTARVVTLVGPGGVGKTRLALEVARVVADRHVLGAEVVELAAVSDSQAVPAAIVAALGLATDGSPPESTLRRGGRLDLLVVLDNPEHVVDVVARSVERLIGSGDAVRVLVTSRERLGVDGEHVWYVAPLPSGGRGGPAHRLFVDRARAAVPSLPVTVEDEVVGRIVRRLDGLPLAIEMAAGQLVTSDLDELAAVLDERIDDLRSPRRPVTDRHRSLGAVLAWSEERLSSAEAAALAELSVFAGPVSAADVVGVLGRPDAADLARSLVERSLVALDRSASPLRFQLLNTVRDLAARRLAEAGRTGELAARHAAWFSAVVRDADRTLRTVEEPAAHRRIEAVLTEVRAAHRWAREHDVSVAAELSAHLHLYASTRLADEPLQWAEITLALVPEEDPHYPRLLASAATGAINRGDLEAACRLAARGIELAGPSAAAIPALEVYADATVYGGQLEESAAANAELLRWSLESGDRYQAAVARAAVAIVASYRGLDVQGALAELAATSVEDLAPSAKGWVAYAQGELLLDRDPERAFRHLDDAVALARTGGSRVLEGVALVSVSSLRARVGELPASLRTFAEVIRHWDQLADHTHQLTTLRNMTLLLHRAGAPEAAAELLGTVDREDVPTYGEEAARLETVRAWAEARLGASRFAELSALGRGRDVGAAAAWALAVLAEVEQRQT